MSTVAASVLHPPRAALVELVGPAGAGKTALLGELRRLAP
jgi:ribose 1,5-bisphosphokinase PhnN